MLCPPYSWCISYQPGKIKMEDSKNYENDLLHERQNEIFMRLFPVVVYIAVLAFVGLIGNVLAMIFYTLESKRTTTVNLIIVLSIVDFNVCVFLIPKLVEMIVNIRHSQRFLCKVTQFVSLWAIATSCFLLWIIAIERHRKICKPFAKQITIPAVKYIVAGIVIFSLALAIRNLIIYDIVVLEIPASKVNRTIIGYFCTATDDPNLKFIASFFYALDFLLILMIWITIIVTYSNAVFTILKRRIKRTRVSQKIQQNIKCEDTTIKNGNSYWHIPHNKNVSGEEYTETSYGNDDALTNSSLDGTHQPPLDGTHQLPLDGTHQPPLDGTHQLPSVPAVNEREVSFARPSRRNGKYIRKASLKNVAVKCVTERNLTIMMFVASMVFILSFAPFFVVRVIMRNYVGSGIDYELKAGVQFALKLPFLNSVFNPVIYCIFNPKFRKFLKRVFCWSWQ
ncbi:D(2) dopamine receptor-like [Mercenaria mercenaria]|uniref:D(2) dopamine receptor-like n=1 Tax=Mercenaria mercenaria TaxID=6596 RepID=UPI00234EA52C|nr:D(2) dopamine receptor-like [Mercenaria mercenaria]